MRQKLGGLEDRQRNIEGLKLENELMKSTLARNGETIKQLKLSEEQLHQDNNTLKKEIIRLSKKIAELEEINVNALSLDKNVKEMNKLFEAMGEVLNRRKENDQSATKNKRKREDENEVTQYEFSLCHYAIMIIDLLQIAQFAIQYAGKGGRVPRA